MPGTPDGRGKTLTPVTNWAGVTQSAHPRIRVISARPEPQTGGQSTTKGKLHPMKTTHSFRRDVRVEDKIIDATVKCFERYGIQKTSMDDIAKIADRKSTRLNSSHSCAYRMPSSA